MFVPPPEFVGRTPVSISGRISVILWSLGTWIVLFLRGGVAAVQGMALWLLWRGFFRGKLLQSASPVPHRVLRGIAGYSKGGFSKMRKTSLFEVLKVRVISVGCASWVDFSAVRKLNLDFVES
jgi:hypothetical protein